ncbi:hypothetical protein C5167_000561 [Papaver somniferum]|uniref:IBB domain-containing protein n=1 Tax=Papaver somniferum TaxID=3469 RepID=A0A4Y7KT05_PAPSO|nr:hypothetical protein C5167_000561 [Papaver somniferum]
MADENEHSQRRGPIKSSVGNIAANQERQQAVTTKKVEAIRDLRRLLSKSGIPPVEAALRAEVIPALAQCLAFGSPDEQLLEAAWCLTNIAAGEPEQTKSLLPSYRCSFRGLVVSFQLSFSEYIYDNYLIDNQQCLSLSMGPDPTAASELIKIGGILDSIFRHLNNSWILKLADSLLSFSVCHESFYHLTFEDTESFERGSAFVATSSAAAVFDIRKEVAYALGNLCVALVQGNGQPNIMLDHLTSLVGRGCIPGSVNSVRSADIKAASLGLHFLELVMRGMPGGEGPKLVEREDGIDAMERFQFHENEDVRILG